LLSLIVIGLSGTEIAEQLVASEGMIKSHINHFLSKIDAGIVPKQLLTRSSTVPADGSWASALLRSPVQSHSGQSNRSITSVRSS
jgi:hypothetical protein